MIVALVVILCLASGALAREINLSASFGRVETIDGVRIATFVDFNAVSGEYTLKGASGVYNLDTEVFEGYGSDEQRVLAIKAGEEGFEVSASQLLAINLQAESLRAEGAVEYTSSDTYATADLLVANRRDEILTLIQPLIDQITSHESRTMVLEFLDRVSEDDRLVFMQGNVRVEQDESTLSAAWVVFNESRSADMISVAGEQPIELHFITKDSDDQDDADQPSIGEASGDADDSATD